MPDEGFIAASVLLWTMVAAVAGLMAWRLWRAFAQRPGAPPLPHYWYYGALLAILAWIVGTGGIPDYWQGPFGYLVRAAFWIGLCFLVGESVNWTLRTAVRALRRRRRERRLGRRGAAHPDG